MREIWEDAVDRFMLLCGCEVDNRPPRYLRRAIRMLGSDRHRVRQEAEQQLESAKEIASPLLRDAAQILPNSHCATALRAANLLVKIQDPDASGILHSLVKTPRLRESEHANLLKDLLVSTDGVRHYVRQCGMALTVLEQRPESYRSLIRYRQSISILNFLGEPLPADLMVRSLLVRTVGGENLSLVRLVLWNGNPCRIEHISQVRASAAENMVQFKVGSHALEMFTDLLQHPSPSVNITAIYGLDILGDPSACPSLRKVALDKKSEVRLDAKRLLNRLSNPSQDYYSLLRSVKTDDAGSISMLRSVDRRHRTTINQHGHSTLDQFLPD